MSNVHPRAVRAVALALFAAGLAGPVSAMPRQIQLPEEGHHLIRYDDGTMTLNDFCPVQERPLGTMKAPLFVNRCAVGFC
ncbi:hypothetical protein K8I85_06820 [bacterium]|nr:hypothetical protein [bacterium]